MQVGRLQLGAVIMAILALVFSFSPRRASAQSTSFGDGAYVVGVDIQPGAYGTLNSDGGCLWERDKGFSGSDVIDWASVPIGPAIVVIRPTDTVFRSENCGTWVALPNAVTRGSITITASPDVCWSEGGGGSVNQACGSATYPVSLYPGDTLTASVSAPVNPSLRPGDPQFGPAVDRVAGGGESVSLTVTCGATPITDTTSSNHRIAHGSCTAGYNPPPVAAPVQPQASSSPPPQHSANVTAPVFLSFGDGIYAVGSNLPPGGYQAPEGDSCSWERLSGWDGTADEIVDSGGGTAPTVTIAASDVGFQTNGCGKWTQAIPIYPNSNH